GDFEHRAEGQVRLELCLDCRGIWFDAYESPQLSPAAVASLFHIVQSVEERPARALATTLHCPACHDPLVLTQDLQHTTHFTYWRCAAGDGRFTPFLQFLREKEFMRGLTPAQLARVGATLGQVRCKSCGGAI